ncbi:MAG: HAD-IA family hydrolase [Candidatus Heimdallarchaeota archaeon]|nr:HAD-IA family hydrolase [Candidatus Heimdallarchaeota archaeon]
MTLAITCVIFDFDNTLVHSHIDFPAMKIAMAKVAKKAGIDFGDEKKVPFKYTAGMMIEAAEKHDQENDTQLTEKLWAIVEKYELEGMKNMEIENQTVDLLHQLKKSNFLLALLTNNSRKATLDALQRFNLFSFFAEIVAREDVKKMKPDKEGLELILKRLSLKREETVFVGDSWVDGVAAKKAKIKFVLLRDSVSGFTDYPLEIWKHIQSIEELYPILDGQ